MDILNVITVMFYVYFQTIGTRNSVYLFVCFVALRPKSTAMVMAGRSVDLTTLFSWASLNKWFTST